MCVNCPSKGYGSHSWSVCRALTTGEAFASKRKKQTGEAWQLGMAIGQPQVYVPTKQGHQIKVVMNAVVDKGMIKKHILLYICSWHLLF